MADGRSELSNPSANSRRPTIDSNMSRDRSHFSRDFNLLVAPGAATGNCPAAIVFGDRRLRAAIAQGHRAIILMMKGPTFWASPPSVKPLRSVTVR